MLAAEGRPYTNEDFAKIKPISGDTTVAALIDRLRTEFGLDRLNPFVMEKTKESIAWLPANGMPLGSVEDPATQSITRTPLVAPASVRLAVSLMMKDIVFEAMRPRDEPTDKSARTKKETV